MPHDNKNNLLKVGDEVFVRFKVTSLSEGEDFCNVSLETVHGRKPDGQKETWSAVNTAVTERLGDEGLICASVDFDFQTALNHLKSGSRVARKGWNGSGMWLAFTPGSTISAESARSGAALKLAEDGAETITINGHIDMKTANGSIICGWHATQTDMLAEDWYVVLTD